MLFSGIDEATWYTLSFLGRSAAPYGWATRAVLGSVYSGLWRRNEPCTSILYLSAPSFHSTLAPALRRIEFACANSEEDVVIGKYLLGFSLLVIYRVMHRGEAYR